MAILGIYDIAMCGACRLLPVVAKVVPDSNDAKFVRFCRAQTTAVDSAVRAAAKLDRSRPTVWIHCASLGEYGIARPIIRKLKSQRKINVILTFFSPTGYEALAGRSDVADAVLYLPFDTRRNARRFLDAIRPQCAVFMVAEFWHNYLDELRRRHIPALLVSAIIRSDSAVMRSYGNLYRQSAATFRHIFVLDNASVERLGSQGIDNASVNGDPLFDNAAAVAATEWHNRALERFAAGRRVFIAGSIHNDRDLELTTALANANHDVPFIIVPHEITESTLRAVETKVDGDVRRLSQCTAETDFAGVRAIIVDNVGQLAYIYRLGTWAYVGGGFTRLLHSVIEPIVYGLPVAFGPVVTRKVTPAQLESRGIGRRVSTVDEITDWFAQLKFDDARLATIAAEAAKYMNENVGATARVVDKIESLI